MRRRKFGREKKELHAKGGGGNVATKGTVDKGCG